MNGNLLIAGVLSALAGMLHLAGIFFGAPWYRFFGAGEKMASLAEQGSLIPALITLFIALVLFVWSAYAFSAAGLIRRLPLIRTALVLITSIYLGRGVVGLFFIANSGENTAEFMFWSSSICIVYGLFYLIGLNLKTAVGSRKSTQALDAPSKI